MLPPFPNSYAHIPRHWCPHSEQYAGGDALLTALCAGWQASGMIVQENHWFSGSRRVVVYRFALIRDMQVMIMAVIGNPYVVRLIAESRWRIVASVECEPFFAET
jgi:hypothetical protein